MSAPKSTCPDCRLPWAEHLCDDEEEGEMESEALTLEIAQELAATSVAALKPGDVLAVRMPLSMNARELHQAALYGQKIEAETGVKVAFIPGDEFAHVTINITVNMAGATPDKLAGEIRREITEQARTARGGHALLRLASACNQRCGYCGG